MNLKETQFEADIEASLLTNGGWTTAPHTYNREFGLDLDTLIQFLEATQPDLMKRYKLEYGEAMYKARLIKRLDEEISKKGMLSVFRNGIIDRGIRLKLAFFKPESKLNEDDAVLYEKNIFHLKRQFKYSTQNENSIDMVLLINGFPLISLELKNQLTGQSIKNGKAQYCYDRDPREKVFQFNNRFLVYFAVDLEEVVMTTRLNKADTYFLPFNQGSNGAGEVSGKGNPPVKEGYQTAYLWEKILTKDSVMEIIKKYMHLAVEEKTDKKTGDIKVKKTLIFPRYHQLDVVTKLLSHVKENGSGHNYLIQHSAGSGKSNSIAWLAHRLSSLHDANDKAIFNSVIVVTDRKVLDAQLQDTIYQFEHKKGVVECIDKHKKSEGLRIAIDEGRKIIITTIHKFLEIHDKLKDVSGRRFAIIIDEAHSSQNGRMAANLRQALADTEDALREYAKYDSEIEKRMEEENDKMFETLLKQGKHTNQSFFAFTATPKPKTLRMFGEEQADGGYRAFHIYSMKQAIEEGFILDVLKNYTTYQTYWKVMNTSPDNPELPEEEAKRRVRRWQSIDAYNIQQKTAIMIEQFRAVTKNKIGGKAKAMIVTQSRLQALRYCNEFKKYIERKGYDDLDVLVAFSGVVKDGGKEYRESDINKTKDGHSIAESQLPEVFEDDDFNMLIVAEKYQTGFDEPLLHTMFVDKKLEGVKAVQTLSRLNRCCSGKYDTFVLDFVNTKEDIQKSFAPYYEDTTISEDIDVNMVYDTYTKIEEKQTFGINDVDDFIKIFNKKKQSTKDLGTIQGILQKVKSRAEELEQEELDEFKSLVKQFLRSYNYVTQIIRLHDEILYKNYLFLTYLDKILPRNNAEDMKDFEKQLRLEYYSIKETFSGDISLSQGESELDVPKGGAIRKKNQENELLENIINKVNDKYGEGLDESDKVVIEDLIDNDKLMKSRKLQNAAKRNTLEMFIDTFFGPAFLDTVIEEQNTRFEAYENIINNEEKLNTIKSVVAEELYNRFNKTEK